MVVQMTMSRSLLTARSFLGIANAMATPSAIGANGVYENGAIGGKPPPTICGDIAGGSDSDAE